jgi:signal transduction histidine kinase
VLDRAADGLQLAIADDGVGLDPLRQAETGHAGLAGSRELVVSMGGSWLLEAAPGCGTRVVATLPWQDAEAA